jgi:hypothetical protein
MEKRLGESLPDSVYFGGKNAGAAHWPLPRFHAALVRGMMLLLLDCGTTLQ